VDTLTRPRQPNVSLTACGIAAQPNDFQLITQAFYGSAGSAAFLSVYKTLFGVSGDDFHQAFSDDQVNDSQMEESSTRFHTLPPDTRQSVGSFSIIAGQTYGQRLQPWQEYRGVSPSDTPPVEFRCE
jgi:hypothetical protein